MLAAARATFPGWEAHPDVWLIIGLSAAAYYLLVERVGRLVVPAGSPVVSRRNVAAFSAALALIWIVSDYPIHDLAERYLYSVHMVQHFTYSMLVAPLLVLAAPAWMARHVLERTRTLGLVRFLSRFAPAMVVFNLVLVVTHVPAVVHLALTNGWAHFVIHAVIVATSMVVWMPILSPIPEVPRFSPPIQMAYLFLQSVLPVIPASFLSYGSRPLYHDYERFPRLWGISALSDQQFASTIMKVGTGLVLWATIAIVFFKWFAAEESPMRTSTPSHSPSPDLDHELLGLHRP